MISRGFGQGRDEAVGIKDRTVLEHEENGTCQFDGDDGIGFEFVAIHPGFETLGQRSEDNVIAFGDDGGFAEGPAEVGIAELGSAQALDLAGAGDGAADQATIREEVFDGGEALDVADLVEDGQAEVFADAGDRLNEGVIAEGGFVGQPFELFLQLGELVIVVADHRHVVLEGQPPQGFRFGGQESRFPGIAGAAGAFGGGAVVSQLMGVDASQKLGATPDVEEPLAQ